MNNRLCFVVAAAMAVCGCQNNGKTAAAEAGAAADNTLEETADSVQQPEETKEVTDIASFGLKGPVKEIITTTYDATEDPDGTLQKLNESEAYPRDTISFNAQGMVTRDPFGGVYVYDAAGNFVRGVSEKSVMKRDTKNRVVYYCQRNDDEDDAMFENELLYDDLGRIHRVVRTFWESTTTMTYSYGSDDGFYPIKCHIESLDEGFHITSDMEYNYTEFDDSGNWIERELRYNGTETEEGVEEDSTTTWKGQLIERREIVYY